MTSSLLTYFFIIILFLKGVKKVRATGIGLHSQDEIIQMGKDDLKVLNELLGDKTFFFGDEPTTVSSFTLFYLSLISAIDKYWLVFLVSIN